MSVTFRPLCLTLLLTLVSPLTLAATPDSSSAQSAPASAADSSPVQSAPASAADSSSAQSPATPSDIVNFLQYSNTFASSGQPTSEQFQALADHDFQRVIYLAFTTNPGAVPNADEQVKELGMQYLHIPVDFSNPLPAEFYTFADAMRRDPGKKTLLHCQVNYRASAFSFLYRVIYEDIPVATAKADMNTVWQPNETWRDFIFGIMADHQKDPNCPTCDWTPPPAD